jgi:hypothetical protein
VSGRDHDRAREIWRTLQVPDGGDARFQIGPLRIWLHRTRLEWVVAHEYVPLDEDAPDEGEPMPDSPTESAECERHPFRETPLAVRIQPAMADLPVVVRPENELYLPAGEEVRLLVGTPLWLKITAGLEEVTLLDMPIRRPSETWFGPSTRTGEVCYASRSRAKMRVGDLRQAPLRAITAVHVRNRAASAFAINRVYVPAPRLSLHESTDGRLWTETLSIERTAEAKMVGFEVGSSPPPDALPAERLVGPRMPAERVHVLHSIGAFLRGR